ncbi:MAG: hypothetical protein LAT84_12945 [Balneolia bacterium]|nr:hypothetical protein [Balneolia bacterium]
MNFSDKTKINADIALLSDRRYEGEPKPGDWYHGQMVEDDRYLIEELKKRGFSAVRIDWSRPNVDWSAFRALVLRTTWDYYERFDEFSFWFNRVKNEARLINPAAALEWNMHKSYLPELQQKGIPIVPVRMIKRGSGETLPALLEETGWNEAVVKPAVSGGARLTYRINRDSADKHQELLKSHFEKEDFLLQPFMKQIQTTGEDTLMIFGDRYTHAIRKKAKPGDFRVQDDHGGTVEPLEPSPEQIELALNAMKASGFDLTYGRVDMVKDDEGRDLIMELEIVEPELWIRFHPDSARVFAEEIIRKL